MRTKSNQTQFCTGPAENQTECFLGQRWVKLNSVQDSAESNSILSRTALSQTQFCPGQRWVELFFKVENKKGVVSDFELGFQIQKEIDSFIIVYTVKQEKQTNTKF